MDTRIEWEELDYNLSIEAMFEISKDQVAY